MAFLHPQRVPILPHWHKDFQEWQNKKEQGFDVGEKLGNGFLTQHFAGRCCCQLSAPTKAEQLSTILGQTERSGCLSRLLHTGCT